MIDEKLTVEEPEENQKKTAEVAVSQEPISIDEKTEVDLRELQIKLEKIKGYITRSTGRVQHHEKLLKKLREKQTEIESRRQDVSVVAKHKIEKSA